MSQALAQTRVLVTRPRHQAEKLVSLIEHHGGTALRFPTLEIEATDDTAQVKQKLGAIADYDFAIFVSANAVNYGVQLLADAASRPLIAAIGPATARALSEAGFACDIKASLGFTSEALLQEPELRHIDGKKIVIFRGEGGRELLGRELQQRGAEVVYAEVYRRQRPKQLDPELQSQLAAAKVDAVTATSSETLVNLYELAAEQTVAGLLQTQLVTASERVVKKAAALGFTQPALLAQEPGDEALVDELIQWRSSHPPISDATDNTMAQQTTPQLDQTDSVDSAVESDLSGNVTEHDIDGHSGPDPVSERAREKPPRGGLLSLLAMLIALGALAASAYLWWETQKREQNEAVAAAASENEIESVQRNIAAVEGKLDQGLGRVSELTSNRGRTDSQIDDLRSSVETLNSRIRTIEKSVDDVRGVSASARNNWVRAEAEYFLQAANSRLQLARDPDAALAALLAADDRIKSLGDPSLATVRQQLATEIAALKAVPRADTEGIAYALNGLAARVENLPLVNSTPDPFKAAATEAMQGESAMDKTLATLRGVFTDMVSVKRTDEQATPLLSRDEEFFLKRNLELQLQTARLALLRGDQTNYQDSLRTARGWLQTHFLVQDSAVAAAVETLTGLEAEQISPRLPDISESLRQLRLSAPAQDGEAA